MEILRGARRFVTGELMFRTPVAAIEAGSDYLKVVRTTGGVVKRAVSEITCCRLPEGVGAATKQTFDVLKSMKLGGKPVIVLIPRHLITIRMLRIPSSDPAEVSRMVHLQAGRQTPYSREEVVTGFRVVDADAQGYSTVLLVIARRSLIAERLEAIRAAGLEVERIAITSEGIWNWFRLAAATEPGTEDQCVAVLDIDAGHSEFVVFQNEKLLFSRSLLVGARQLGEAPENAHEEMRREVQESLDRYRSENPGQNVSKLLLTGVPKVDGELSDALAGALKLETAVAATADSIAIKGGEDALDTPETKAVSLSAVLGAAVDPQQVEIDLAIPEFHIERVMDLKRKQLSLMGLLGILTVSIICVLIFASIYQKHTQLRALEEAIAKVKPTALDVDRKRMQIETIVQRLDARGTPVSLLTEIHRITPAKIQMTTVTADARSRVVLRGRGTTMSDVFEYVAALEKSMLLEGVKTTYTSVKRIENREYAEFEISCQYQPQATPEQAGEGEQAPGE